MSPKAQTEAHVQLRRACLPKPFLERSKGQKRCNRRVCVRVAVQAYSGNERKKKVVVVGGG